MRSPVVLDFDRSVLPFCPDELRIPLADRQETVRFGCSQAVLTQLSADLEARLPDHPGCVLTGSGDFHHVSLPLLQRLDRILPPQSLVVVVCDNHPDAMRYPFGIHCGSWVAHACRLVCVRHVHVLGITSADITLRHAWEVALTPFLRRKLTFWSLGATADWLRWLGRGEHSRVFASADALVAALPEALRDAPHLYLSLDKDVLSPDVVRTNWDQGVFAMEHLDSVIAACAGRLVGADITGDVSVYRYHSRLKRLLSWLDGQDCLSEEAVAVMQTEQQAANCHLWAEIDRAWSDRSV